MKTKFRYSYAQLNHMLADEMCPCAFIDLDTFDENLDFLEHSMKQSGKKVRIGTKSLRVPGLIQRALERPIFNGAFIFHPNEIKFLHDQCNVTDFELAYPIMAPREAELCAEAVKREPNTKVHIMVDSPPHLELLEKVASNFGVNLGVMVDCDFSIQFLGQTAGVLRSPLKTPAEIVALAKKVKNYPHLTFDGIMGYEAQEAGVGDRSWIMRKMKNQSRNSVNRQRKEIWTALKAAGLEPPIVNGGGSGCFQATAAEDPITEVTVGSGLYKSYIFDDIDSMQGFQPSMFMALKIVRFPRNGIATAFSGGYTSSAIKMPPQIVLPENCSITPREGFGEVQTPIKYNPATTPFKHGDLAICRLAKAGEPMERFHEVVAISNGRIVRRYPTYRGVGVWGG